ncbi:MAG: GAF domain-containing protein [Spirochaetota bacterium]
MTSIASAFIAEINLFPILAFVSTQYSIQYGYNRDSAVAWACMGLIYLTILKDIRTGYNYGKLALRLIDKHNFSELAGRTYYLSYNFTAHWLEPIREIWPKFRDFSQLCSDVGDNEYMGYCLNDMYPMAFYSGESLADLTIEYAKIIALLRQLNLELSEYIQMAIGQLVANFKDVSVTEPTELIGERFDKEKDVDYILETKNYTGLYYYFAAEITLGVFFQTYEKSLKFIEAAISCQPAGNGKYVSGNYTAYCAIIQLNAARQFPNKKNELLEKANENLKNIKIWSKYAPFNREHLKYLIKAEKAKLLGKKYQAMEFYDKSIQLAKENLFIQEEALASELAGQFYLSENRQTIASAYLNMAYKLYQTWGGVNKAKDLANKYPSIIQTFNVSSKKKITHHKFLEQTISSTTYDDSTVIGTSSYSESIDLGSIVKASQIISSEIEIEKLLNQLIQILIENAGAQRVVLIHIEKGNYQIEADGSIASISVFKENVVNMNEYGEKIPISVIQYVTRTKKNLVIHDASQNEQFHNETYFKSNKTHSILCTPMLNKGTLTSIIYLENNLTSGVFTDERIQILKTLATQAAISIENAKLYNNLERKVEERTSQLKMRTKEISEIFDHVEQGLLTIDKNFVINSEYSRKVQEIFEQTDIARKPFIQLFPEAIQKRLGVYLTQLFTNKFMSKKMLDFLNPIKEFELKFDDSNTKQLSLRFSKIFTEDASTIKKVDKIMVVVDDKTKEYTIQKQLKAKAQEQASKIEKLYQILNLETSVFIEFLEEGGEAISVIKENLSGGTEKLKSINNIEEAYRAVHTLKGNARALNLDGIGKVCHKLEDELDKVRNNVESIDTKLYELVQTSINAVEYELKDGDKLFHKILGMKTALHHKTSSPISSLEYHLRNIAKKESKEQDKKLDFSFNSELKSPLTEDILKMFKNSLLQIVRNSIGHGLETTTKRIELGKPEIGKVSIVLQEENGKIMAVCEDDGSGLDTEKLKQKAVEKKVMSLERANQLTEKETFQIIFYPGFSTAKEVSATSGRGVGMDIVKSEIESCGGKIEISSQKGKFTKFVIVI